MYRDSTDVQDAHRSGGLEQVFCTIATHAPDTAPHRPSHQGRGYSDKGSATLRPLELIGQKGKLPDLRMGHFNVLMCRKKETPHGSPPNLGCHWSYPTSAFGQAAWALVGYDQWHPISVLTAWRLILCYEMWWRSARRLKENARFLSQLKKLCCEESQRAVRHFGPTTPTRNTRQDAQGTDWEHPQLC